MPKKKRMLHEVEEMTKKKVSIKKKVAKKVPEEIIEKTVKEETVPAEPSISEKEDGKHEKKTDMKKKPAKKEDVVKRAIRKEAAHGKKSKLTLVYIGLAVLVIAALMLLVAQEKPLEKLPTAGEYVKLNMPTSYEPGKVKIIEFLKFDCSHCYDLHKNMPQLLEKYGDNVTITYVPVVWQGQGQSTKSIEAYIIAEYMGKGEEMRDALFKAKFIEEMDVMESTLALENVAENVAASIGVEEDFNAQEFNAQLEGNDARKDALANLELMTKYGVQGTPTVIINGNILVNPPTITNLDTVIGSLLT